MISFAFNDRIVARASATLAQWKAVDYGPLPIDRGDRTNVWVRDGDDLIRVGQSRGRGGEAQLGTVTVYDRTDGRLTITEGRRVGTECVSTYKSGWAALH